MREALHEKLDKYNTATVSGKIDGSSTIQNYYDNFEKHFLEHLL